MLRSILNYSNGIIGLFLFFVFITVSPPLYAKEWYVGGGVGWGSSGIEKKYNVDNKYKENSSLDFQLFGGYRFANNIEIEANYFSHGTFNIDFLGASNSVSVSEYLLLTGYKVPIINDFSITPKIGYSWWKLESKEDSSSSSGNSRIVKHGQNLSYLVEVSYGSAYIALQRGNYGFGNLQSLVVGFKVDL